MKDEAASSAGSAVACDKASVVLQAATTVFLQHGFSAATTDMIQREAGVSKATVYARFANKEALFAAVIQQECAKLMSTIRSIDARSHGLRATLSDIGTDYLNIILSPTGIALYRVIVAEAPRFPDLARQFYLAGPKVVADLLAQQIAVFVEEGQLQLKGMGLADVTKLFVSLLRHEAQFELLTHPASRPSAAQVDHWVGLAVTTFLLAFQS
ncbi:transcriptional regulator, TetR family [Aquitalea magnusonii]|uniref:Transcriptional regulator, TetR family n=1 Tax=Aquitalea magnusonii TaxID=332411 RepID=A0A3G9GH40_9NEIS|nr:TetR/AcrR family transcriptional regulator [Aquitalea magnusonii]BBF84957.1 transcriptional regulator, TetR family [Aquitalea magnusonii]